MLTRPILAELIVGDKMPDIVVNRLEAHGLHLLDLPLAAAPPCADAYQQSLWACFFCLSVPPPVAAQEVDLPIANQPLVIDDARTLFIPAGLRYQKIGPRNLHLCLYRPPFAEGRLPAIVVFHAGGFRNGSPVSLFPFAMKLARAGYVVVTPIYRLSGEAPFPAAVHDAKAAVRWVRANADAFQIDPDHIAVAGMSAGGVLAGLLGATNGMPEFEGPTEPDAPSSEVQASIVMGASINLAAPYLTVLSI